MSNSTSSSNLQTPLMVEVLIVGAGPVGIAVALLLNKQGIKCALIEKRSVSQQDVTNSFDGRTLALNIESAELLTAINCLPDESNTQAIKAIRVSQQGHFGSCLLESKREQLRYFGLTVNSIELGNQMHKSLSTQCSSNDNLHYFDGIEINAIQQENTHSANEHSITLSISNKQHHNLQITSKILIAADGSDSQIRQHFEFPTEHKDYHQIATLTKVIHEKKHLNMAHERFLKDGILALLPTSLKAQNTSKNTYNEKAVNNQVGYVSSVVWLQNNAQAIEAEKLSNDDLPNALERLFGKQYGHFLDATQLTTYAMRETIATQTHQRNVILIGNAAHSLHPVAGQGLNLGLQDALNLCQQISLTGCTAQSLRTFAHEQQQNINNIRQFVNNLLNRFASADPLSAISRTLLMIGFEKCTPIRRPFLHYLSGIQKTSPWFFNRHDLIQSIKQKITL